MRRLDGNPSLLRPRAAAYQADLLNVSANTKVGRDRCGYRHYVFFRDSFGAQHFSDFPVPRKRVVSAAICASRSTAEMVAIKYSLLEASTRSRLQAESLPHKLKLIAES